MPEIRCPNCGLLFGKEQRPDQLEVKHRDLIRTVKGGTVWGPCRRCKTVVAWPTEQEPNGHS